MLLVLLVIASAAAPPVAAVNCTGVTCQNGGVCNNYTASPPCICPLPFIPPYCSAAANYCSTLQPDKDITSLPVCLYGGNCTMTYTDPYFNCSCPPEFAGSRCHTAYTISETTGYSNFSGTTTTHVIEPGGNADPIVGGTVSCVVVVCCVIVVVVVIERRRRKKKSSEKGGCSPSLDPDAEAPEEFDRKAAPEQCAMQEHPGYKPNSSYVPPETNGSVTIARVDPCECEELDKAMGPRDEGGSDGGPTGQGGSDGGPTGQGGPDKGPTGQGGSDGGPTGQGGSDKGPTGQGGSDKGPTGQGGSDGGPIGH